ncbi:MAG: hypothetical protein VCC00_10950 [Deltaproteobacteria bacterium]
MDRIVREHDMSALVVLGALILMGLWPVALLFVFFGFIASMLDPD